jgi:hypothetical protein
MSEDNFATAACAKSSPKTTSGGRVGNRKPQHFSPTAFHIWLSDSAFFFKV